MFPSVLNFAQFKFILPFTAAFILFAALLGSSRFLKKHGVGKKVVYSLLVAGVLLQTGFLIDRGQRYALSVKNINEMQVHLGKWVNRNVPRESLIAINDIGAIKFFGERKCLDLEGLAFPQIVPYKIMGKESYVVYLDKHRPDYFIIFPWWYPEVYAHLGLFERVLYGAKSEGGKGVLSEGGILLSPASQVLHGAGVFLHGAGRHCPGRCGIRERGEIPTVSFPRLQNSDRKMTPCT